MGQLTQFFAGNKMQCLVSLIETQDLDGEKFGKLGAFLLLFQVAITIPDQEQAARIESFKTFFQQALLLIRLEVMKYVMQYDGIEFFNLIGSDIGAFEMKLFTAGIAIMGQGNLFEIKIHSGDLPFF